MWISIHTHTPLSLPIYLHNYPTTAQYSIRNRRHAGVEEVLENNAATVGAEVTLAKLDTGDEQRQRGHVREAGLDEQAGLGGGKKKR
jgi:hypothetical protein